MNQEKPGIFCRVDKPLKDFFDARAKQFGSLKNYILKLAIDDGYQQEKLDK